jgi:hypothetical protein
LDHRTFKILGQKGIRKIYHLRPIFEILIADMLEYSSAVRSKLLMRFKLEGSFFYTGKIWIGALKKEDHLKPTISRLENES